MNEPVFLTLAEVLAVHKVQIELYGGTHGIRETGLLESAVAMPQAGFGDQLLHKTVWEMAAAYAYHISENQPFLDGNKRTGLACALTFLDLNGVEVDDPEGLLYGAMIEVGTQKRDKKGLAALLESLSPKVG